MLDAFTLLKSASGQRFHYTLTCLGQCKVGHPTIELSGISQRSSSDLTRTSCWLMSAPTRVGRIGMGFPASRHTLTRVTVTTLAGHPSHPENSPVRTDSGRA